MLHKFEPVAIDLFAGAGGLAKGLENAGFRVLAAVDNDRIATKTYEANLHHDAICAPIEEVSVAELLRKAGVGVGECTLLAGGPPCQGFSLQRRGSREDPRNNLILHYVRMVEEVRPQIFLMENVGALLSKHGKPYLDELRTRVARLGYETSINLLNALDYGVPQRRKRAFLVGMRPMGKLQLPIDLNFLPRSKAVATVRDAIFDLPSPPEDGSPHPIFANHYREARLSALNIERIKHVPQGGGRADLPDHLQLPCHRKDNGHRHLDVYGRLAWDEPSVTLTARFDSFTRGRFAHPEEHRSLTIREGARIQTFPDNFIFAGNREEQARQVGNAVPPRLAEIIGKGLLSVISSAGATVADAA